MGANNEGNAGLIKAEFKLSRPDNYTSKRYSETLNIWIYKVEQYTLLFQLESTN